VPALDYQTARGEERPSLPVGHTQRSIVLACLTAVLSAASLVVVLQGANDEPYMRYRRYDAIVQVGFGTALLVLWCCLSLAVVALVATRKLSRWWLTLLLWAAVCFFYLSACPVGYLEDIEKFVLPTPNGAG
jgi:hypothetical protein